MFAPTVNVGVTIEASVDVATAGTVAIVASVNVAPITPSNLVPSAASKSAGTTAAAGLAIVQTIDCSVPDALLINTVKVIESVPLASVYVNVVPLMSAGKVPETSSAVIIPALNAAAVETATTAVHSVSVIVEVNAPAIP